MNVIVHADEQENTKDSHKSNTKQVQMISRVTGIEHVSKFLLHIRHPPCYSYVQSSPVNGLALIRGKKKYTL
jgi:hypothetical protein